MITRAADIQKDSGASRSARELQVRSPVVLFICHELMHSL